MAVEQNAEAGQAAYTPVTLAMYDAWVLGLSNTFLWKCPTSLLRREFTRHATTNHLDVGVGTGYYPDKCLTNEKRRIALLDLNRNSLAAASARISRFEPECYCRNVLEPLNLDCPAFDSISLNYLLHCLPGNINDKVVVFENLANVLNPGGVLFGSTILGKDGHYGAMAAKLMNVYNSKAIFDNLNDDLEGLRKGLERTFTAVDIRVKGCVAVFSARKRA